MKRTSIIIFISFNIFSGFAQIATDEAPISFTHPAIGLILERQPVEIKHSPSWIWSVYKKKMKEMNNKAYPQDSGFGIVFLTTLEIRELGRTLKMETVSGG
ncbi:hypothetical protein [Parapedobacter sp.]